MPLSLLLLAGIGRQALVGPSPDLVVKDERGTLVVQALDRPQLDVIRIHFTPKGVKARSTEMLARRSGEMPNRGLDGKGPDYFRLDPDSLRIGPLTLDRALLEQNVVSLHYPAGQNLYGMRGTQINYRPSDNRGNPGVGLFRNGGAEVRAGSQGDGGAPLAYSTTWGLLVDSVDGVFKNEPGHLVFQQGSRPDLDLYLTLGPPKFTLSVVAALSGCPPMPPRWSLGFMNSQWGTDQGMVSGIVDEYRHRQIPIDAFIFDFDFKAWGEDDYGEFRWNSTNGTGNVGPMKYPDGASGKFAREMSAKGIKLVGIMKPRILMRNADGTTMKAAAEADAHHWWLPNRRPYVDYFSHRPADDLDFSKPDLRAWYWKHAKGLYDTGIVGWWNDEADDGFDSLGFFHMQQSLYEGQRRSSNERVWSLNRNFYLGAQRFGFGTWSGDIRTGFPSMAAQELRMLTMTDLGQPHWSMDTGGFNGHPSDENYARWMEFASVVPIMRVHGTYGERRQPWVYGDVAEAAAKKAIEWRYSMLPSFYSWEHEASQTGIGIVRPMFWEFPDDPSCANLTTQWMLGDRLLVSPVVTSGATTQSVYLPRGEWVNLRTDASETGPKWVNVPVDARTWSDVPMFVRAGAILASQPVPQFTGEKSVDELTLDVWPSPRIPGFFEVYDDDGKTYAYEHGASFSQSTAVTHARHRTSIDFWAGVGRFATGIRTYRIRLHTPAVAEVNLDGKKIPFTRDGANSIVFTVPAGRRQKVEAFEILD